jgi:hypothetical protein
MTVFSMSIPAHCYQGFGCDAKPFEAELKEVLPFPLQKRVFFITSSPPEISGRRCGYGL